MNPMLQIYHNWAPDYGPPGESNPTLEQQIEQLKWMQQYEPQKFNFWPFNKMGAPEAKQFQKFVQDEAFQNPIPSHIGEPETIGPYQVGYRLLSPEHEQYGTDGSFTDSLAYSADKGLLSQDVAENRTNNLLDDPSEDYLALVQAGDITLEDAIRMLGYVPPRLRGLLGE